LIKKKTMKLTIVLGVFLFCIFELIGQTLPQNRGVDWTVAGLRYDTLAGLPLIDMTNYGATGDGLTNNDSVISSFVSQYFGAGAILYFPSGNFVFNNKILLPDNYILRGAGADSTVFVMDLGGSGHAIDITGTVASDSSRIVQTALKNSSVLQVWDETGFTAGDWVQIKQLDNDLATSSWSFGQIGQMVHIDSVVGNQLFLSSSLRMDYDSIRMPYIQKIIARKNIGIECLKIKRLDDPAPQQACNIQFKYAVNCWVTGIESENCTFAHLKVENGSNIYIARSYFHHGFDYGGGGRAYGVVFQFATGECLAEDNVFEHLRHAMLLQAGANGNVFAYNYSFDPYWSSTPNDAAGDMVLHGNYVYANLFEQNICRNIVIDNSHGPNGPYNTFLRNRAEGYGILFSASNSPNQNFIGNDITNTGFPYSFVNYTIQGTGHFIYGNNNKGTIVPSGTSSLADLSYVYNNQPLFVSATEYAKIGTPNIPGSASIPANNRVASNAVFSSSCMQVLTNSPAIAKKQLLKVFPNPVINILHIESVQFIDRVEIYDELGRLVMHRKVDNNYTEIALAKLPKALYIVQAILENGLRQRYKIVKR
jgi:hypothetical protein